MENNLSSNVLAWYQQFVCAPADRKIDFTRNFFTPSREDEIAAFESEFGKILPKVYITFLQRIGSGRLTKDASEKVTYDYENSFLSTAEIADLLRGASIEWKIYPDFIDKGEVPFFSIGNNDVLVFRDGQGSAVYFPFLEDVYARDFDEFLVKLMNDCTFYKQVGD